MLALFLAHFSSEKTFAAAAQMTDDTEDGNTKNYSISILRKSTEAADSSSGEPESILRRQRDLVESMEAEPEAPSTSCSIRVKKVAMITTPSSILLFLRQVVSLTGKCVKLKDGLGGCLTNRFLDPENKGCAAGQ